MTKTLEQAMERLNVVQREVAIFNNGAAMLAAVAGSGKTETVAVFVKNQIETYDQDTDRMLVSTFSKAGAEEINDRLRRKYGVSIRSNKGDGGARVGTLHSVSLEIVRDGSPYEKYEVDARDKMKFKLKDLLGWGGGRGMKWEGHDLTEVQSFIADCKNALISPEFAKHKDRRFLTAYRRYEEERHMEGLLTFDDMTPAAVEYLTTDGDALLAWQGRYDVVVLDEFQDTNIAQMVLARYLSAKARVFLVVGDDDQCQPAGTMVQVKRGLVYGNVPIEEIHVGEMVRVFQKKSGKVVGSRRVVKTAEREFEGDMYNIKAGATTTQATPNHRFFARWTNNMKKTWVVYLMRKDWRWRIGVCQLFNTDGILHLSMRARLEKADAVWILGVYHDQSEAHTAEFVKSLMYQIPTCCFQPTKGTILDSERVFEEAERLHAGLVISATGCLDDHGRDIEHPFWPMQHGQFGTKTMTIHACNLEPGIMSVHLADLGWEPIERMWCKHYYGPVYSLEVAEHHSYVADGVASCNCIYQFRGSKVEHMTSFAEEFNAKVFRSETNYRSVPEILEAANKCIVNNNPNRVEKTNKPQRSSDSRRVEFEACSDMDAEADLIAERIKTMMLDGYDPKHFSILYRCNAQSRAFEEAFIREKIPHVVIGGTSFYRRKEVADILAYLKLAVNNTDNDSFKRAVNRPFRFIGKMSIEKIERYAKNDGISMLMAASQYADNVDLRQRRQVQSLEKFCGLVGEIMAMLQHHEEDPDALFDEGKPWSLSELLAFVIRESGYEEWLIRDEGTDTSENSRLSNLRELVRTANRFKTAEEMLDYIDDMERANKAKDKDDVNAVKLMTIHKSKGLEFPVVFLVGAAQGILPHVRCENVADERRLFYVAVTRARDRLFITCPLGAWVGDKIVQLDVSLFVGESGLLGPDRLGSGQVL